MRICELVRCESFPCADILRESHHIPGVDEDPSAIRVILVSEAPPRDPAAGYEGADDGIFAQTTVLAFRAAGCDVQTLAGVRALGVHLTTAVKCGKTAYAIAPSTIRACAMLLDTELSLYPNVASILLMGDVAIRALNEVARRNGEPRPVRAGPTYRIRREALHYRGRRVFPSYLQAGPAFFIETGKQRVIAEDIAAALAHAAATPLREPVA